MVMTLEKQAEKVQTKESYELGNLEMVMPDGVTAPVIKEVEFAPEIASLLGMQVTDKAVRAQSKTTTFQGKLFVNGRPDPIAILDDVKVTALKFTNPSGVYNVRVFFEYFVTSHGYRTGRGAPTGEPLGAPQGLYFKNQNGGIIHSWGFPYDDFILQCGWNRQYKMHTFTDTNYVSWFDLWEGVQHKVQGLFYKC